ncbi:hypothetical protein B7494_g6808 [Chlorociboria aeruginascens]|nr:hypothetical protein B7494_g6808 [Chlorociboria aeruginascens]
MDDDLNSSDVERAVDARFESKKRSKQLGFTYGSRKTQYLNHLWDLDNHELPYLAYQDIILKLHKGNKLVNLVANVVIRNEKGKKKNRNAMSVKAAAESWEVWVTKSTETASNSSVLSEETVTTDNEAPTTPSHHMDESSDGLPKRMDTVDFAVPKTPLLTDALDLEILRDDGMFQTTNFDGLETSEQFMDPALLPGSVDWDDLQSFAPDAKDTVVEAFTLLYIDPRLLTGERDFEGLVEPNSEQPTAVVEEAHFDEIGTAVVEEACFDEIVSQTVPITPPELLMDAVEFVRFFSKINVSTNSALAQKGYHKDQAAQARSFYVTHSQDQVTSWVYPCENAEFGCSYQNPFLGAVCEHQLSCKIKSPELFIELNKVKAFPCDRPGCKSSFNSASRLKTHINENHE